MSRYERVFSLNNYPSVLGNLIMLESFNMSIMFIRHVNKSNKAKSIKKEFFGYAIILSLEGTCEYTGYSEFLELEPI